MYYFFIPYENLSMSEEFELYARNQFGKQLAALRKEVGITQEELAGRTGVDPTYISAIERGTRAPGFNMVTKLVKGLKIGHVDLYTSIANWETYSKNHKK
ncbi:helix-turn-helix domain-containing protein [Halobacillus sp. B23F22_1]|uniref:helix-turn-helix domain-containing protein n=1 Tax=Halobacillus sp. B23F22_1 TaxID=3459514 RepID=UPI00373EEFC7